MVRRGSPVRVRKRASLHERDRRTVEAPSGASHAPGEDAGRRSARNTLQRAPITFRIPRSHGTCARSCGRRNFTGIGLEDSSLALGALCALPGRNGETADPTGPEVLSPTPTNWLCPEHGSAKEVITVPVMRKPVEWSTKATWPEVADRAPATKPKFAWVPGPPRPSIQPPPVVKLVTPS